MTFADGLVEKAREFEYHFENPVSSGFYERIRRAIEPFDKIGDLMVKKGMTIVGLPFKEWESAVRKDHILWGELSNIAESAYYLSKAVSGLYNKNLSNAIIGAQNGNLLLFLDDAGANDIRHEVFHFILDKMLNDQTKYDVRKMFDDACVERRFIDRNQRKDKEEYFASGGEAYFRNGIFISRRRLRRRDPKLHDLVARVLDGDKSVLNLNGVA